MNELQKLILISLGMIMVSGYLAFSEKRKKNSNLTLQKFLSLDRDSLNIKYIMVGMIGGVIFGFIDNAGLWFGMNALDPWFNKKGITGNEAAGYGNTFSDALGAFLGTFIGIIVSERVGVPLEDTPVWANAFGVTIGCLLGIFIGKNFG